MKNIFTSDIGEIIAALFTGNEPVSLERDFNDSRRVWFEFNYSESLAETLQKVRSGKFTVEIYRLLAIEKIFRNKIKNI